MINPATRSPEQLTHLQGMNDGRLAGTCGLVCCKQLIQDFASPERIHRLTNGSHSVTENHVVRYALNQGLCNQDGGSHWFDHIAILRSVGIKTQFEARLGNGETRSGIFNATGNMIYEHSGVTLATTADHVRQGKGVILYVNQKALYSVNGGSRENKGPITADHAVVASKVVEKDGKLLGFIVNDSGLVSKEGQILTRTSIIPLYEYQGRGQFIPSEKLEAAWLNVRCETSRISDPVIQRIGIYGAYLTTR